MYKDWILIFMFWQSGEIHAITATFNSQQTCEKALAVLQQRHDRGACVKR